MHLIFLLARVFPYWALPASLVLAQLAIFFRRRKNPMQWSCFFAIVLLVGTTVAWFGCRGDLYSDQWVRSMVGD